MAKRNQVRTSTTQASEAQASTPEAIEAQAIETQASEAQASDELNIIDPDHIETFETEPETIEAETVQSEAVEAQPEASEAQAEAPKALSPEEAEEARLEAMVLEYLAKKEAKAKAEAEAKAKAIAEAKALLDAKRGEYEAAVKAYQVLVPSTPIASKKARDLAITGQSSKRAPSAENSLGLSGKKLALYGLLTQEGGVSDKEGSEALGWASCSATISKIMKLAEMASLKTSKGKGSNGETRYAIHLA